MTICVPLSFGDFQLLIKNLEVAAETNYPLLYAREFVTEEEGEVEGKVYLYKPVGNVLYYTKVEFEDGITLIDGEEKSEDSFQLEYLRDAWETTKFLHSPITLTSTATLE